MGISPWYWWADVPVRPRSSISFPSSESYSHGSPTVKYRGFFLNDEQPVLWNWAKEHFKMRDKPPFQVNMYEKVFELLLRLKGNYTWPASESTFMQLWLMASVGFNVLCRRLRAREQSTAFDSHSWAQPGTRSKNGDSHGYIASRTYGEKSERVYDMGDWALEL